MKKTFLYSTKRRQLREFLTRLNRMLKDGSFYRFSLTKRKFLIGRIKRLQRQLGLVLPELKVKHTLTAATMVAGMGFANYAGAQEFDHPVTDPFGITIPSTIDAALADPALADLDDDGDQDLLLGGYYGDIFYYENVGTNQSPQFKIPVSNPFGLQSPGYYSTPAVSDLDSDGDFDIIAGAYDTATKYAELYYFQNTGSASNPTFAAPVNVPFGMTTAPSKYVLVPEFADLDSDGDFDLLVGGSYDGGIFYYENTGTANSPAFGMPVPNPMGLQPVQGYDFIAPTFGDIDGDGDLDLLAGSQYGAFLYYENTGTNASPSFASAVTDPWGVYGNPYFLRPAFTDLDGDGDLDVLATNFIVGNYRSNIMYYENTSGIVGMAEADIAELSLLPNPASEFATLSLIAHQDIGEVQVEVLNALGQRVTSTTEGVRAQRWQHQIDLTGLTPGVYWVKVTGNGQQATEKLVVQ